NLEGIEELAMSVFGLPVRIGQPCEVGGLSDMVRDPMYSTAVGLALLHAKKGHSGNVLSQGSEDKVFSDVWARMKSWFGEFF
ncbi:MAG: cell division protein FtsA, partial [Deferribacteraceae bacterium]|nr:cell division protein FtsA [Deferribacteraceae bacterium]